MSVSIGVDVGASFTKVCVLTPDRVIRRLTTIRTPVLQKPYFASMAAGLADEFGDCAISSCGYGQLNIEHHNAVSELAALARGLDFIAPNIHTALDIGGQDSKAISCAGGKVTSFALNDQCAAGCGLFFLSALNLLDIPMEGAAVEDTMCQPLSSICAVFAQTEIVRRAAAGETAQQLLDAAVMTIVRQAARLLGRVSAVEPIAFTGGLSLLNGASRMLGHATNKLVVVPPHSSMLSAIGCAVMGLDATANV
jgi:predicted CoA-substrate-specific enzyme activase